MCFKHKNSLCLKQERFIVFQAREIPCVSSTRDSLCPRHNTFLVFPAEQSLCSQQNIKTSEGHFWPKIIEKNLYRLLTPSSKSRTELNLSSSGVIFRARRADNAQNFIAPPKRLVVDSTPKFSNFFSNEFDRPKNREDGSDLDENLTEIIAAQKTCI